MRQGFDLEKKSDDEITTEVNDHLEKIQEEMNTKTPPRGLWVQLLIRELQSRDQRKQTRRMIACTYAITAMTVVMMVCAIIALRPCH